MKITKTDFRDTTRITLDDGLAILGFELQSYDEMDNLVCTMDLPDDDIKYDDEFTISMVITKENEAVYRLFEELFIDIDNLRLTAGETDILGKCKKKIKWYSDMHPKAYANYFEITDEKELYRVSFHTQGFKDQPGSSVHIPVVINNNDTDKVRSANYPFNRCFMKLFDGLKELDFKQEERKVSIGVFQERRKTLKPKKGE